jgi:hypothetical protein
MVIDRIGAAFFYEGKKYVVGEQIVANDASEYEGLFGRILEIRDGEDKETENYAPDIYCEFEEPVLKSDIWSLEQRMSGLYGERKTLEDISLDLVIMAPDMISTIAEIENNSPTAEIYILTEDWAVNDNYGHSTGAFTSLEMARLSMRQMLTKEKQEGCIPVWEDEADFVEDESDMSYSAYREGFWCESHYELTIQKLDIRMSPAFLREAADHHNIQSKQEDFITQTENWNEVYNLSDEAIYKLRHSKAIAERVDRSLSKNDAYWEAYWESFSAVAHDMVREVGGEEE